MPIQTVQKCPNCQTQLQQVDDVATPLLRKQLTDLQAQLVAASQRELTLRNSLNAGEKQEADVRTRLLQNAKAQELRADAAERETRQVRADLAALWRICGGNVHKCAACEYAGQLKDGEYCMRCGENVIAQIGEVVFQEPDGA